MSNRNQVRYVPAGSGPMYWGPGDRVTFLLTGVESRGGCFIVEGLAPPGGGPDAHVHEFEDESFYILEGAATFQAGGQTIRAKAGDFVHVPRGTVHSLKNEGDRPARALIIVSPAGPTGLQQFFEESFTPTTDREATPPPVNEALLKRMMASAARNGVQVIMPNGRQELPKP